MGGIKPVAAADVVHRAIAHCGVAGGLLRLHLQMKNRISTEGSRGVLKISEAPWQHYVRLCFTSSNNESKSTRRKHVVCLGYLLLSGLLAAQQVR